MSSNLRPTTRECVHLVRRGHFRSRDKHDGHIIRSAEAKNHMLNEHFADVCFLEKQLLSTEILHVGIGSIYLFAPWPWPWPDDLRIFFWDELVRQVFRKLSSDRQTDRQTRPKLYRPIMPIRRWLITKRTLITTNTNLHYIILLLAMPKATE